MAQSMKQIRMRSVDRLDSFTNVLSRYQLQDEEPALKFYRLTRYVMSRRSVCSVCKAMRIWAVVPTRFVFSNLLSCAQRWHHSCTASSNLHGSIRKGCVTLRCFVCFSHKTKALQAVSRLGDRLRYPSYFGLSERYGDVEF